MNNFANYMPGVALCLVFACPAWYLGREFPIVGGPVFGILLGMLLALTSPALCRNQAAFPGKVLNDGVKFTAKKILQYSIVLLGFSMNLLQVIEVGRESLAIIAATLASAFLTAYYVGKALGLEGKTRTLIGVGTSICGGSAIAATAPVIKAEDEEIAQAISTIFLFNVVAVFLFPALGSWLGLSDAGFGMWAGTAINDTSSVVAAGAAWSAQSGNDDALVYATIVKLTRTLMIVPITLALAVYAARQGSGKEEAGESFALSSVFPWFVLWFAAAAFFNTVLAIKPLSAVLATAGKYMIVMSMFAIGLNTNLYQLIANGRKPIMLGVCCWAAVAVVSLLVQNSIGIW